MSKTLLKTFRRRSQGSREQQEIYNEARRKISRAKLLNKKPNASLLTIVNEYKPETKAQLRKKADIVQVAGPALFAGPALAGIKAVRGGYKVAEKIYKNKAAAEKALTKLRKKVFGQNKAGEPAPRTLLGRAGRLAREPSPGQKKAMNMQSYLREADKLKVKGAAKTLAAGTVAGGGGYLVGKGKGSQKKGSKEKPFEGEINLTGEEIDMIQNSSKGKVKRRMGGIVKKGYGKAQRGY